jgi:type IV pilus assembly protein PilC
MKFSYKARTKDGDLQVGNIDSETRDSATRILLGHGLYVLGLEEVKTERFFDRISDFLRRVKTKDLMIFTRQFSTLVAARVPLSDSLGSLYRQTTNPIFREAIAEIANDIDAGLPLSQALGKHKGIFSEFYVNMMKSAEVTGRMSEVLDFLADYLENQAELMSKVRNALIYPAFIITLFFGVIVLMITFVLPQLMPIFEETKVELPLFTRFMVGSGEFVSQWWWAVGIVFVLFLFMIADYMRTKEGKVVRDEMILRIPVMGTLFRKMYIARFAESAEVLIRGGLTIPQAIEISSHTIGNTVYNELLHRASSQVRKGRLLSESLAEMSEFPPLVSQLIAIGESTGSLEKLLDKIRLFYTREVNDMVDNLVNLLQPFLMVVIGVVIGGLFAAILLPLYSLTQSF